MIEVVEIGGDARARGLAHGRALKGRIAAHLADWRRTLETVAGEPVDGYLQAMLRETDFKSAIRAHAPDLLEEVEGIADGAGLDRDLVYALQLMDEEWFYRVERGLRRRTPEKCSSFGVVSAGGSTWIGQNMDLGQYTDGHQVVLRIAADGEAPAAVVFTTAGVIALMGVNAAGIGVCVNSLPQLPAASTGVPVAFLIRRLLQARSLDEAAELVQAIPHATNQHYLLAGPGAVRSFEASAAGVAEYHPPDPGRVLHTNHPLGPDPGRPESEAARENSARRLASLTARLGQGNLGLADFQGALSACDDPRHPVCRTGGGGNIGFTCGSMISEIAAGHAEIAAWVSPGPPSREGFDALGLARV
jgi:hypothetical protein